MEKIASHKGTVTEVASGQVKVHIEVLSACASCESHGHCGFAEKSDKVIEVTTPRWQEYHAGDNVTVTINQGLGLKAVAIAYLAPAVLLLALLVTMLSMGVGEGLSALIALAGMCIYVLVLYLLRGRLQQKFTFELSLDEEMR